MPRNSKGEKRPADVIGAAIMVGRIALSKKSAAETRSGAEVPIVPDAAILATGAHDPADRNAGKSHHIDGCIRTMIDEPSLTVSLPRTFLCWVCALAETARRIPELQRRIRWPHKS
jgi:hypothetical protein